MAACLDRKFYCDRPMAAEVVVVALPLPLRPARGSARAAPARKGAGVAVGDLGTPAAR